ncbi:MAG: hypothetical protein WC071_13505 [Victivallaceae bacterium]
MKRFFQKLKNVFKAGTDAWRRDIFNPPSTVQPTSTIHNQNASPEPPRASTYDFREQMIQNEFTAENCTQEQQSVHVFGPAAGGNIPSTFKHESFTNDGLLTNQTDALMTGADGRLIKSTELHGGGLCHNCQKLTDKLNFCTVCKMPLCFRCFRVFENITVCNQHYRLLHFNKDTWGKQS